MVDSEAFRRFALSLDGTVSAPHVDRTAFKVRRTYATLAPDGASVNLKFSADEQALKCAVAPDAFEPVPGGWGRMGFTTMWLDRVTAAEMRDAVTRAWRHAVPVKPSARRKA
jgi:hypothetical protein